KWVADAVARSQQPYWRVLAHLSCPRCRVSVECRATPFDADDFHFIGMSEVLYIFHIAYIT
ncbi:hypothetical protein ABTN40_20365, partial [Acinetobacter baumannii]